MQSAHQRGLTLLELLTALAISAIAMAMGFPQLDQFLASNQVKIDKHLIITALNGARLNAVNSNSSTVVCTLNGRQCKGVANTITIFIDNDNNGYLASKRDVIDVISLNENAIIKWQKSRIRYTPSGRTGGFNGTLQYCNAYKDRFYGFVLILARTGRLRSIDTAEHC